MQGRQIRLNGEELKTQNLFFVAFSLEKLKGFVHCTNKHVCKYNAKNIFLFFCNLRHGKQTHLHHFQTTKRQLKQRFAYQKVTTVWKNTLQRLVLRRHKRTKSTANTFQTLSGFYVLRHCTRKTFVTISSALQFASVYKTTNKQFDFYFQSALHHKQINSCALGQRKMPLRCLQTSCSKCIKP